MDEKRLGIKTKVRLVKYAKRICLILSFIIGSSIIAQSATIYIDPTNTASNQNGTIENPYNSWTKVVFANGNTYLQKRGTTYNCNTSISIGSKTGITIGSYGSGSNAKIVSSGTGNHIINISSSSNVIVKDLEVTSTGTWISCIIIQGTNSANNLIDNCHVHTTEWGIRILTTSTGNRVLNSIVHDIGDDGIYIKDVASIEIAYCNIYDINKKFLINPDQSYSAGDGIQIASTNNLYFNIHDNTIDHSSMGNKFCIIVYGNNYSGNIENNIIIGNAVQTTSGIYLHPTTQTVTLKYNTIKNSNYGIYSYAHILDTYYNVFSSNKTGISVQPGYTLNARNNVFYNNTTVGISSSSSASVTLKNNIFNIATGQKALNTQGSTTSNNNHFNQEQSGFINGYSTLNAWKNASGNDLASLLGSPGFINPSGGDFHVQPTSLAVNHGAIVNLSRDYFGTPVPQSGMPDIGIHEVSEAQNPINNAPVINNQAFTITQNSPTGTLVGSVIASDPDAGQTLTYSIVSGNTDNLFSINATSGNIITTGIIALLNYNLTIRVTDNGSPTLYSQATITINVTPTPVNQAPLISNQSFTISQSLAIGSLVGNVIASDPEGQTLAFSIVGGNTNAAFTINPVSGNILVAASLPSGVFNLTVRVTDNGSPIMYAEANIMITVTASMTNQPPYLPPSTFRVLRFAPNGTFVGQLIGSDPNQGQILTYTIQSGNIDNAFALNPSSGSLTVNNSNALNWSLRKRFLLQVQVTDNGQPNMSFTQTITVNIVKNKTSDTISFEEVEPSFEEPTEMKVYPNPSPDGRYSVSFGNIYESVNIQVFDMSGKLVKSQNETQASQSKVDLSINPKGTYLIKLNTGIETKILKAIKN